MTSSESRPAAVPLDSERLHLEPLTVAHADEMFAVLDDLKLHTFIGGLPPTRAELTARFEHQVGGHSRDGSERWLNWVIRHRDDGQAVGTLQATVTSESRGLIAEIA